MSQDPHDFFDLVRALAPPGPEPFPITFNPVLDGVEHINAYSKGRTHLGRLLSNFAHTPFTVPDGTFASVEAYWYWLGCQDPHRDELMPMHGPEAKRHGRLLRERGGGQTLDDFQAHIKTALEAKISQNSTVSDLLAASSVPIVHYYVTPSGVRVPPMHQWVWRHVEKIRERLKEDS